MHKLAIGVLGVGSMGKRHAENIRRFVPEAKLVAVADVAIDQVTRVAAELEIEHGFSSLEDMLESKGKEIDCIVIATPDKFHARAISIAASAGKHILCEKPLALNIADAHTALTAVANAGVQLQIGFMRRYDPAHVAAMKRIDSGEIGDPVVFKSIGRDKEEPPFSAYESQLNGMLFYNSAIHDFDLARWLVRDEVKEVHAYGTVAIRPAVAEFGDIVAGTVNMKYESGAVGNVECYVQSIYGYDVRTEIVGSRGSILIGSLQQDCVTVLTDAGGTQALADHFLTRFEDAYVAEMRDFVHRVQHGKTPQVTGKDGLRALEIAVAAEQSYLQSKVFDVSRTLH